MKIDFSPARKKKMADALLRWFAEAMRPLPWRKDYQPYGVWISEIMLQQTQMERGVRYYAEWMRRFPDIRSVALADEEAILSAWEGLGYYSRARNLHAAARRIVEQYGGAFPDSYQAIRSLPGVGDYTAGAVAAIAFDLPEPAVDANVLRIFARICDIATPITDKTVKAAVTEAVRSLLSVASPRLLSQALMELGALVCGKNPCCGACPLREFCSALRRGTVAERPVKKAEKKYGLLEMAAGVIVWNDAVFVRKRPPGGLWGGLWEFPGGAVEAGEEPEQAARRHIEAETGLSIALGRKIATVRHGYTTWRVVLHGYVFVLEQSAGGGVVGEWVHRDDLAHCAFPAGHRKLLECMGWK